jgi:diguanylate cyclase (GGDEF)-like protein
VILLQPPRLRHRRKTSGSSSPVAESNSKEQPVLCEPGGGAHVKPAVWLWLAGMSLLVVVGVWLWCGWGSAWMANALDMVLALLAAAAAAACARTAQHVSRSRRMGWCLLAAGLALWSMRLLLVSGAAIIRGGKADAGASWAAGVLVLPLAATLALVSMVDRRQSRAKVLFDGLIIASSLFVLSLQTGLSTIHPAGGPELSVTVWRVLPACDIILATVAVLLLSSHAETGRKVVTPLALAMLPLTLSDMAYSCVSGGVAGQTRWHWLAVGWPASFLLIMVAARRARLESRRQADSDLQMPPGLGRSRWLGVALPYGPVIAVFCLILINLANGTPLTQPTRLASTGIGLLLIIRQLVALSENRSLLAAVGNTLRRLEHQSSHDALTGLPNRLYLTRCIEDTERSQPPSGQGAVLLLNLDRFRQVNETLGHSYGDQLLRHVANTLTATLPSDATLARLSGDEFGIFLPTADTAAATRVAELASQALQVPCLLEQVSFVIEATVGIACASQQTSAERLLQQADIAMNAARREQQPFLVFRQGDNTTTRVRLSLLADLRTALSGNDELVLHYQPKVDVTDGTISGVEALLRWKHPRRGFIPPGEFIQSAEESGIIMPLTRRVLRLALDEQSHWLADGLEMPVAVNISARCLQDHAFPEMVEQLLRERQLPARLLTLELTESTVMIDTAHARTALYRLRRAGVTLSIDDFGTGYSSLSYLKNLPVTELKIDRSFITHLGDHTDNAIVRSVIDLGHNLGLTVVAEGIETETALAELRHLGCDLAQGYYIARPMPADQLSTWLAERPTTTTR